MAKFPQVLSKQAIALILSILTYLLLCGYFFPYYQYRLYSDSISYISVAQHYLRGDFAQAVNGYWAPLVSWVLVPLLKTGLEPLICFKIFTIGSGLISLLGINHLFNKLKVTESIRLVFLPALAPLLAWFALQINTPDIASAAVLLFYLAALFSLKDNLSLKQAFVIGFLGGLAYLTKNYNFFFILVHLSILGGYLIFKSPQSFIIINIKFYAFALFIFFLVSAFWVIPISLKYHKLTTGTAGKFNYKLFSQNYQGFPYDYQGLIPPPYPTSVSSWEDPSYYTMPGRQLSLQANEWAFLTKTATDNFYKLTRFVRHYNPYLLILIPLGFLYILIRWRKTNTNISFILVSFLLYPLGYILIYMEERHIWFAVLLSIILLGQLLSELTKVINISKWLQYIFLGLIGLSLINQPLRDLYDHRFVNQRDIFALSQAVKGKLILAGKNVATQDGSWHKGLFLSYFSKSRFFGEIKSKTPDAVLYRDLERYKIEYYLVWGKPQNHLTTFPKVATFPEYDLTVYKVK